MVWEVASEAVRRRKMQSCHLRDDDSEGVIFAVDVAQRG